MERTGDDRSRNFHYCLENMKERKGSERRATFRTVLALGKYGAETMFFEGALEGQILEAPDERELVRGMPFSAVFYIPEIQALLRDVYNKTLTERGNFMTHREMAFRGVYAYIRDNFTKA